MKIESEIEKKIISSLRTLSYKKNINIKGQSFSLYKSNNSLSLESPIFRLKQKNLNSPLLVNDSILIAIPLHVLDSFSFLTNIVHGINVKTVYNIDTNAQILSYSTKIIFFSSNHKNKLYHFNNDLYYDYNNDFFDRNLLVYDIIYNLYNLDIQPRIPIDENTIKLLEILIL